MEYEQNKKYEQAKERVSKIKEFYTHLALYLLIIPFLYYIDWRDSGNWWVQWPAMGWGIFVLLQGISILKFDSSWEEKKIKEIMDKEK